MDSEEAAALLESELARFRELPYINLASRMEACPLAFERAGTSGVTYQIEIDMIWDGRPGEAIRVIASIDDGRWRAFVPLTRDFIKAPDGHV